MRKGKLRRMLLNSVPIETERLILRRIQPDDAWDMYDYASRPEVSRYLLWSPHANLGATEGYIESLQARYLRGLYGDWAIELKEKRRMIGTCGYALIDSADNSCEIGYVLSPDYQGNGYMTEAVRAVLKLTFAKLEFSKAELRIMKDNLPSIKLAERVGFLLDRVIEDEIIAKGEPRTLCHYIMTANRYMDIYG